jgi:hypothetical protein
MDNKISYAITVCNEIQEITKLVTFLIGTIRDLDEIVIQYDKDNVTPEVLAYLNVMETIKDNIKVVGYPLNKDFASFKNNLKQICKGDWIFQIDADEMLDLFLVNNLPTILSSNDVEMYLIPRINTVNGITDEWINKWGWVTSKIDGVDDLAINFPDFQYRIFKNVDSINWKNKVHEVLDGFSTFTILPTDYKFCLLHHKTLDKQIKQNELYNTI